MRLLGEVLFDWTGDEFGVLVRPGKSLFLVFLKYGLIPVQVLSRARRDARRPATLNAELDFEPPVFGAPLNVTRFRIFFIVVFNDDFISEALDMDGFEVTFEFIFAMMMSVDTFRALKVYCKIQMFLVFFYFKLKLWILIRLTRDWLFIMNEDTRCPCLVVLASDQFDHMLSRYLTEFMKPTMKAITLEN